MPSAIKVENLSKHYFLRHQESAHYHTLRESMQGGMRRLLGRLRQPGAGSNDASREEFWALRNIDFEIAPGERVGVIGRNGAGKSTLLKLLSRITEPTTGRISITGRVASLLEVGTGFHPELTGRENISLNGAILGMRKEEITRKFDEIVAFAGVEKFLDTPVKRYSSGMYVRLAFAVAAHLEPEILIVDEVLAVGDAQFQKKCLGKLQELGSEGRTVLFVSHNTSSILQLTDTCILLDSGQLVMHTRTESCIAHYLQNNQSGGPVALQTRVPWFSVQRFSHDRDASGMGFNQPIVFRLELETEKYLDGISIILGIDNSIGARILTARARLDNVKPGTLGHSLGLDAHNLSPGTYFTSLTLWSGGQTLFEQSQIVTLELIANQEDEQRYGTYISKTNDKLGCFRPLKVMTD